MKKLIITFVLSLGSFGCSQRLGMNSVGSEAKDLNDVEINSEGDEEHPDLVQCMELLEYGDDDDVMCFLDECLDEDPGALTALYPSLNKCDKEGFAHYIAAKGSLELIKRFLELAKSKGILEQVVNLKSACEVQPIHLAALRGDVEVVRCFIEYGADSNAQDDYTNTVLHYAARKLTNVKVVRYLLEEAGADIQKTIDVEDGSTLLHWAVESNNTTMVRYLLDYCYSHEELKGFVNLTLTYNGVNLTAEQLASRLGNYNINLVYELFKEKNNLA